MRQSASRQIPLAETLRKTDMATARALFQIIVPSTFIHPNLQKFSKRLQYCPARQAVKQRLPPPFACTIYRRPDGPNYSQVAPGNRVAPNSPGEAETTGDQMSRNYS